jgi:hypothetical protein
MEVFRGDEGIQREIYSFLKEPELNKIKVKKMREREDCA